MHWARASKAVPLVLLMVALAVWAHGKRHVAEWRLNLNPDLGGVTSLAAGTTRAFIGGTEWGSGDSWVVYGAGTRKGWEEVRTGHGKLLGLAGSQDGKQLLLWVQDGLAAKVEWLDVSGARTKLVEQARGETIGGASWARSGDAWVGLSSKFLGGARISLVLHRHPGDAKTLAWPGSNGQVAEYWPASEYGTAYVLLDDGRLYRCNHAGAALVLRLPLADRRKLEWRRYSPIGDSLFALSGTTLMRADVRSRKVERRDVRHMLRGLGVPSGYTPRIQAVSASAVLLIVEPIDVPSETAGNDGRGARIYLVHYPGLRAQEVLALPRYSILVRSATGHGVAAAGEVVWVAWYDRKELVLNRLRADE